ncbi:MAG: LacI family DNA-binding transcriptional regulator, partial [Planctomycetes bacterium]|nr:LacI family DNA-binding transcriptional regulator [Planctomycetota bacterium]
MSAGPITIRDVARRAGVSTGTASRALRGSPLISAPCIDRVRLAASDLAYRPLRQRARRSDRALAGRTIAVVLLGMDSSLTGHPAIAEALHGVEAALGAAGATLLLADVPGLDALPPALARGKVDGLILKGAMQGDAIARCAGILGARLRALPAVWVTGRPSGCDWGDAAGSDDRAAGTIAADALIAAGHRQVAIINPKPDHV